MKTLLPYRNKFHYSFIFGLFVIILCILSCGPSGDPDASGVRTTESLTQIPLPEKYSNQQGKLPLGEKDENKASQGIVEKQNRAIKVSKKIIKEEFGKLINKKSTIKTPGKFKIF